MRSSLNESRCLEFVFPSPPRQTRELALADPSHPAGSFHIADDPNPRVIKLDFPAPPAGSEVVDSNRLSKLQENGRPSFPLFPFPLRPSPSPQTTEPQSHTDIFLQSLLDLLPTSKYTVIYTTAPFSALPSSSSASSLEPEPYEMDTSFSSQAHMELKRDMLPHSRRENGSDATGGNVTLVDGPLFERYAFLSPGEWFLIHGREGSERGSKLTGKQVSSWGC